MEQSFNTTKVLARSWIFAYLKTFHVPISFAIQCMCGVDVEVLTKTNLYLVY